MICRIDSTSSFTNPNPKRLYLHEEDARDDAEKLAIQEGKQFYLLETVAVVGRMQPPIEWKEID